MTDNEIVKALECCGIIASCKGCPYHDKNVCQDKLCTDSLDLINRQKAEIERLQKIRAELSKEIERLGCCNEENVSSIATLHQQLKIARAEAIKEFAERLLDKYEVWSESDATEYRYVAGLVDNLVKEMVGDRE